MTLPVYSIEGYQAEIANIQLQLEEQMRYYSSPEYRQSISGTVLPKNIDAAISKKLQSVNKAQKNAIAELQAALSKALAVETQNKVQAGNTSIIQTSRDGTATNINSLSPLLLVAGAVALILALK